MPRETNLLRVKLVAHTLLDVQIQETALSPVIVSHPFTSSGISAPVSYTHLTLPTILRV